MTCPNCVKNFSEVAIKRWLRRRTGNLRNCPTCRVVWTNFNVYVNIDLNDTGPMPELIAVCDEVDGLCSLLSMVGMNHNGLNHGLN